DRARRSSQSRRRPDRVDPGDPRPRLTSARPVEGVDQAIGVGDESVVLLGKRAAPLGDGVVLRDEVGAPGDDLTPEAGELGIYTAEVRVHGLDPGAGGRKPRL